MSLKQHDSDKDSLKKMSAVFANANPINVKQVGCYAVARVFLWFLVCSISPH